MILPSDVRKVPLRKSPLTRTAGFLLRLPIFDFPEFAPQGPLPLFLDPVFSAWFPEAQSLLARTGRGRSFFLDSSWRGLRVPAAVAITTFFWLESPSRGFLFATPSGNTEHLLTRVLFPTIFDPGKPVGLSVVSPDGFADRIFIPGFMSSLWTQRSSTPTVQAFSPGCKGADSITTYCVPFQ